MNVRPKDTKLSRALELYEDEPVVLDPDWFRDLRGLVIQEKCPFDGKHYSL